MAQTHRAYSARASVARYGAIAAFVALVLGGCDILTDSPVVGPFYDTLTGDVDYLIAGDFQQVGTRTQAYIARIDTDGDLVSSFDPVFDGPVLDMRTVRVDDETMIVAAGAFTTVDGIARPGVALLDMSGKLDGGFTPDLGPEIACGGFRRVYAVLPVPGRDSIIVGGLFDGAVAVGGTTVDPRYANLTELRLSDGAAVTTFAPAPNSTVYDLAKADSSASEWRALVVGDFMQIGATPAPFIAEVNADGAVVMTIPDPTSVFVNAGERFPVGIAGVDDDEIDYFVTGESADLFGGFFFAALRSGVGVGGTPGTFSEQGFTLSGIDGFINTVSTTPNGRIFFGGEFTQIEEFPFGAVVAQAYVAAYTSAGLDTSFSLQVDGPVYTAEVSTGSTLLIGGAFSTSSDVGSTGPGYLVRLGDDNEIDLSFDARLAREDAAAPAVRSIIPIVPFEYE
jgi:hypothetical protein